MINRGVLAAIDVISDSLLAGVQPVFYIFIYDAHMYMLTLKKA